MKIIFLLLVLIKFVSTINEDYRFDNYTLKPLLWDNSSFTVFVYGKIVVVKYDHIQLTGAEQLFKSRIVPFSDGEGLLSIDDGEEFKIYSIDSAQLVNQPLKKHINGKNYVYMPNIYGDNLIRFGDLNSMDREFDLELITLVDKNGVVTPNSTLTIKFPNNKVWKLIHSFHSIDEVFYVFSTSIGLIILRNNQLANDDNYYDAFSAIRIKFPVDQLTYLEVDKMAYIFYYKDNELYRNNFETKIDELRGQIENCRENRPSKVVDLLKVLTDGEEIKCPPNSILMMNIDWDTNKRLARPIKGIFPYQLPEPSNKIHVAVIFAQKIACFNENLTNESKCPFDENLDKRDILTHSITVDPFSGNLVVPAKSGNLIIHCQLTALQIQCTLPSTSSNALGYVILLIPIIILLGVVGYSFNYLHKSREVATGIPTRLNPIRPSSSTFPKSGPLYLARKGGPSSPTQKTGPLSPPRKSRPSSPPVKSKPLSPRKIASSRNVFFVSKSKANSKIK